jgi:diaminobutyrate-2-oxoglutarate transaminase
VVRLLPPLTITDEQANAVLDRLSDAVASVAAAPTALRARGVEHGGHAGYGGSVGRAERAEWAGQAAAR